MGTRRLADDEPGERLILQGSVLSSDCRTPLPRTLIEIWQADNNGAYIHTKSGNAEKRDGNFQGFGRFLTGSSGEYLFRTIRPVPYPGRTPHIHMAVRIKGKKELITQCYIKGHPGNEKDGIWKSIRNPRERRAVTIDFTPIPESRVNEHRAKFDVVLGLTLAHGGHLTHGSPVNVSGKWFRFIGYGVNRDTEQVDLEAVRQCAWAGKRAAEDLRADKGVVLEAVRLPWGRQKRNEIMCYLLKKEGKLINSGDLNYVDYWGPT